MSLPIRLKKQSNVTYLGITFTKASLYGILRPYIENNDINIRKVLRILKKDDMIKMQQIIKNKKVRSSKKYLKRFIVIGFSGIILSLTLASSSKNELSISELLENKHNKISITKDIKKSFSLHEINTYTLHEQNIKTETPLSSASQIQKQTEFATNYLVNSDLPAKIRYQDINIKELRGFLKNRNSILVNEPYFSAIITTAKEYDLNPVLLFAITGQEQSLVPESGRNALEIANNPFNVHYSWQRYNTNIIDSTQIAARTIIRLAEGCPENTDPLQWINRKYAEDQNWWKGVNTYYTLMENAVDS